MSDIYNKTNNAPICPMCGGKSINYSFIQLDEEKKTGFGVVWCDDCKSAIHISRMKVADHSLEKEIPNNLRF